MERETGLGSSLFELVKSCGYGEGEEGNWLELPHLPPKPLRPCVFDIPCAAGCVEANKHRFARSASSAAMPAIHQKLSRLHVISGQPYGPCLIKQYLNLNIAMEKKWGPQILDG